MVSFTRKRQIYRINGQSRHFFHSQWAGGVILLFCSAVAILLSNLPATAEGFHRFWQNELAIGVGGFELRSTFEEWINDGLMVLFFFTVGLEIKRELISGQLSSVKQAALPFFGAIGGMIVPALIFFAFNAGKPTEAGWGIPMATDIAFALGVLSLLGNKVPLSLKVFLTALAIVDDLGAILVIAIFYTSTVNWPVLAAIAGVVGLLVLLNRMKVYSMKYYLIPSIVLWLLFLQSGIHATIAGVIIAMTIPVTARFRKSYFLHKANSTIQHIDYYDKPGVEIPNNDAQLEYVESMRRIARNSISPSRRLESALHSTVTFFIMPLFALANAGVRIDFGVLGELFNPLSFGILAGLVIGKPLGIFGMCRLGIKLKLCSVSKSVTWGQFFSVCCVGGIGFTMSIFIDNLAFSDPALIDTGKVAVLTASILAGILSFFMVRLASRSRGSDTPVGQWVEKPTEE